MTTDMPARVALVNLGCRVNRVETDLIANKLQRAGCELCAQEDADVVIINTCAVTGEAQTKTRKAVRHASRLPGAPIVLATGCVANLFADELRAVSPGVVVEPRKDLVAARALGVLGREVGHADDHGVLAISPTPTGRTRPGIKIQDGCNNRCSYCIVWKARGPSRSLSSDKVMDAIREACERQAREVVLTGINLGSYRAPSGDGIGTGADLPVLLEHILANTDVERVRLSSIEPPDVTERLLQVMAGSGGRIAPFLHVCLQSGCDATLRRMRRVYDTSAFMEMVRMSRGHLPGIALETDVIVGFPGETDEEFEQSFEFCQSVGFSRMHVFRYSKRPGTPAATAPNQVDPQVSVIRGARLRKLAQDMRQDCMRGLLGKSGRVLVQSTGNAVSQELFDVRVAPNLAVGELADVRYAHIEDGVLVAASVADRAHQKATAKRGHPLVADCGQKGMPPF